MPPNSSGEYPVDPAIAIAIRYECERAVAPVLTEVREINSRLSRGDTVLALLDKRVDDLEEAPKTESHKRGPNPYLMMIASGALGAIGSVAAIWLLIGLGQQAAKGSP